MKKCWKCDTQKDESLFWKDRRQSDGLQKACKSCQTKRNIEYRDKNRDYFKAKGKERYKKELENDPEYNKKRYQENKDAFITRIDKARSEPGGRLYVVLYAAKRRSKQKGYECDLTIEWINEQFIKQDGKCLLTGIELSFDRARDSNTRYSKYSPSIDRINPFLGYTKDNCRLVCTHINLAMNQFGESSFKLLAELYLNKLKGEG